jgi:hypothetical protein
MGTGSRQLIEQLVGIARLEDDVEALRLECMRYRLAHQDRVVGECYPQGRVLVGVSGKFTHCDWRRDAFEAHLAEIG